MTNFKNSQEKIEAVKARQRQVAVADFLK